VAGRHAATPARRAAYEVLRRTFEEDAWTDRALPAAVERHGLDARDRALAQRLAYGAVQRRGTSDWLVERLADRPLERIDPSALAALRLGLYELLFADATPDAAAVNAAVGLAKGSGRGDRRRAAAAGGFVNAILRRASREARGLLDGVDGATPDGAAVLHSHPLWLARMWWDELGPEAAASLMAAMNVPAESALRVNALRAEPAALRAALADAGECELGEGPLWPPEALVLRGPPGERARAGLDSGELVAQSRASQLVPHVVAPEPGGRVLDLCAAPGMKSTSMAALMANRGEVVSVELDRGRASALRDTCARLGATCVRVVEADAASADLGDGYDRVLVDPPCSDLGTLASRPDARWRKDPGRIERLAALQRRILERGAAALAPGGRLVYSTCTISAAENGEVVAAVLAGDPGLAREDLGGRLGELAAPADPGALLVRPDRDRTEGFFVAALRRSAA
jgi:16S rRNA (cytosine967-C5)-methyltransferase